MVYFEPLISLLIHIIISAGLCLVIITAVYLLNTPKPNSEKNMSYECGFKPFDFAYYPFDIQFYRVGILFLLFDVEILYFFPWVLNFYKISIIGHLSVLIFVVLLMLGFLYEYAVGALSWYPQKGITRIKIEQ